MTQFDNRRPALSRLALCVAFLMFAASLVAVPSIAHGDDTKSPAKTESKSELFWKSGDRLPGRPVGFKENKLTFQSALFREPLEIDANWLSSFETNRKSNNQSKSNERFAIQLIDGQIILADVKSMDQDVVKVASERAGEFEIDRKSIASIVNRKTSQTLVSGSLDLDLWDAKRGEKRFWKANDDGEVVATRDDIHLFFESELPESCLIDFEIAWDEELDFALALQIPSGARRIGSIPRLESWAGSIVFSNDDDFEVVMADLDEDARSLKLLIHWDQKTNKVVIHDHLGVELASAEMKSGGSKSKSGIFLQNKSGDFRVKSLGIRSAAAGFDPSNTTVQVKSGDAINATMESFDGSTWIANKDNEQVKITSEEFVGAFKFNPDAKFKRVPGDTLRFVDGEKVTGKLIALDKDSITIDSSVATEPIVLKSDGLKQIHFNPSTETTAKEGFNHILISDAGEMGGRLESGSPTDDNVLFWRVPGATKAVPFANAILGDDNVNAKVVLELDGDKTAKAANRWPDTLYLNNRDLLPVHFRSANEKEIVVDSFFENRIIPGSEIRAIEFGAKGQIEKLSFADAGWRKSGKTTLKGKKFKLNKGSTVGHAELMGRGGFEFELDWPSDKYGLLKVEFGRSLGKGGKLKSKDSMSFAIMLYAQQYYVTSTTNARQAAQHVRQRGSKSVKIKVAIEKDQLVVYGNGKECLKQKLKEGFGRNVSFQLTDSFGMHISCDLENLKLSDGFLSGDYIDRKRKELILTIPRLKARNPPGQILCATNLDLARGNIVSMNEDHVMFQTDSAVNRYARDILGSIIWIDTESLIKSLAAEETEMAADDVDAPKDNQPVAVAEQTETVAEDKRQVAQVLMRGGRRVTLMLKRWDDDKLIGESKLLGNCEIPFEQIYEIRMGKFATEASDIPWSDWIAKMAPKPKLDSGGRAGQDDASIFGSDSPLIGQSPKLTLSMLNGDKLKLESLKGKIVVLDFWATWCGPCVKSLPGIKKVIDGYPDSAVRLITINQNESKQKIKKFLESRKLELQVALDDGEVSKQFDVEAIPQTVVIGSEGKIQFVKVGASNNMEKKLRAAIDFLLDATLE